MLDLVHAAADHLPGLIQLLLDLLAVPLYLIEALLRLILMLCKQALLMRLDLIKERSEIFNELFFLLCILVLHVLYRILRLEIVIERVRPGHEEVGGVVVLQLIQHRRRLRLSATAILHFEFLELLLELLELTVLLLAVFNYDIHRLLLNPLEKEAGAGLAHRYLLLAIRQIFLGTAAQLSLKLLAGAIVAAVHLHLRARVVHVILP